MPIPVYFMRSVDSSWRVFFWETPTRPTCKWLGKCTCVTSSRRCVQHAQCRHIAERRADGAALIGAQLDVQPTLASVRRAEQKAQATFAATLARAKRLDAQGHRAGCTRALAAARRMYNL